MGTSGITFNKKEKEKQRQKKNQDKQERRENRKAQSVRGQSLDQMLAYVDENGNLSATPPNPQNRRVVDQQNIVIGVARQEAEPAQVGPRRGTLTHFDTAKGYGFIEDSQNQQRVFVHKSEMLETVNQHDSVTYELSMTPKGASAVQVKKWVG